MKAAKEFTQAKPSGSSLTSPCTMSSGPAASSFSGYFSCLQLATSPKCHLFSAQALFPTSPKATCCCLGKGKLAEQTQCVSSYPRSWLGGLSGLYLLPYLPVFDMLTCCISSLSPRWEERVGCSLYTNI